MPMLLAAVLAATAAAAPAFPPGEDTARAALESTPRHFEYVDVPFAGGPALRSFVAYPERKDEAPVVIVIHDIYGLGEWIRGVADRLAGDGFIAIVPDLLSGRGPNGGGTDSLASRDDVVKLVGALNEDEVNARLDAVRGWALQQPSAAGTTATLGFCWGGARSFAYPIHQCGLDAAVVFYGSSPDTAALRALKTPVLGLYGGDDARVNATIEPAAAELKKRGRSYEHEIYPGAGHGFLKSQSGREGANKTATEKSWPRVLEFLRLHLE